MKKKLFHLTISLLVVTALTACKASSFESKKTIHDFKPATTTVIIKTKVPNSVYADEYDVDISFNGTPTGSFGSIQLLSSELNPGEYKFELSTAYPLSIYVSYPGTYFGYLPVTSGETIIFSFDAERNLIESESKGPEGIDVSWLSDYSYMDYRIDRKLGENRKLRDISINDDPEITPEEYKKNAKAVFKDVLAVIKAEEWPSKFEEEFVIAEYSLKYFISLLDYESYLKSAQSRDKSGKKFPEYRTDLNFYSDFSELNFNNSNLFMTSLYNPFFERIMKHPTFNLPDIGEKPVEEWFNEIRPTIKEVTGLKDGLFYDMLASRAYAKQLGYTETSKVLSQKQIANIKDYFGDTVITDDLLEMNNNVATYLANLWR